MVIDAKWDRAIDAKYLIVKYSDGTKQTLCVYITFSVESSKGEMIIFSRKNGKLIRPYLSLEAVIKLNLPAPVPEFVRRQKISRKADDWRKREEEAKQQRRQREGYW